MDNIIVHPGRDVNYLFKSPHSRRKGIFSILQLRGMSTAAKTSLTILYQSQAGNYISDELRLRGALVFQADPGSVENISRVLEAGKPEIVFFETVTNGSEMAILNVEEFLRLPVLQDLDPLIILDNTLPASTGIPLETIMADSARRIIGVESGTKFIGLNREMCGMAYTTCQTIRIVIM